MIDSKRIPEENKDPIEQTCSDDVSTHLNTMKNNSHCYTPFIASEDDMKRLQSPAKNIFNLGAKINKDDLKMNTYQKIVEAF